MPVRHLSRHIASVTKQYNVANKPAQNVVFLICNELVTSTITTSAAITAGKQAHHVIHWSKA